MLLLLALFTMNEIEVVENFTGRVLEGSNDRLLRVERKPVEGRGPASAVVVLQDCGPLPAGATYEFGIWAGGWEDVRPCLSVNGRPPAAVLRGLPAGFGVVYGQVRSFDEHASWLVKNVEVEVHCGEKVWKGKADHRGRFWTMLPAGHCRMDGIVDGYKNYEDSGSAVTVRSGLVEASIVKLRPWGWQEKMEYLGSRIRGIFR
jgi:hypothetical protein